MHSQMGIANVLPVNDSAIDIIHSFVGRPWSIAGTSGTETDIANMADVSHSTITLLHQGIYEIEFLHEILYEGSLEYPLCWNIRYRG